MNRLPRQLSGGQLQRVSIARALSLEPKLMVCDEPIAALDVSIRAQVLNLLLDIQAETGMSYLFIAHDLGVVEVFAHEVVVLKGGKLIESGATEKVFRQPEAEYTRTLIDSIPTLTRKQHDGHVVASQSRGRVAATRRSTAWRRGGSAVRSAVRAAARVRAPRRWGSEGCTCRTVRSRWRCRHRAATPIPGMRPCTRHRSRLPVR